MPTPMPPDRPAAAAVSPVVLIVDDAPANLAMLHDALEAAGYLVRVATDGMRALESARRAPPDLILLDALMPGLDGFETCRQLKADLNTKQIPVVFMTGLCDTEHVVQGFQAGGVDYVTKPIRPREVLARIASHLRNSQLFAEAEQAADAAGDAMVTLSSDGRIDSGTPLACRWLTPTLTADGRVPLALRQWLAGREPNFTLLTGSSRLSFSRLTVSMAGHGIATTPTETGRTRLLIRQLSHVPEPEALARLLKLTAREAEVLYWVTLGKTNPEIGMVLDMSPRTVNKHLEHIFTKLNVETRTAAATVALNKGRAGIAPQSACLRE